MPLHTKTLTIMLLAALGAANIAIAQEDMTPSDKADKAVDKTTATELMLTADLDQNSLLDRTEFVSFTVAMAEAGDPDAQDLVLSGQYDDRFDQHDRDQDGQLTLEELMTPAKDHMKSGSDADMDGKPEL